MSDGRSGGSGSKQAVWPFVALAALIIAGGLGAAVAFVTLSGAPKSGSLGSTGKALIGGPFKLKNAAGETVSEKILNKPVNFVYFGFTHCPDFCPTELTNLADAKKELKKRGIDSRIVFISVDPKRDTPKVAGEYAKFFDDEAIGLSGDDEAVKAAMARFGVYRRLGEPDEVGDYNVDHSTLVYVMDKNAEFIRFFRYATKPTEIADKLAKDLKARQ